MARKKSRMEDSMSTAGFSVQTDVSSSRHSILYRGGLKSSSKVR